ncbi:MAG: hypothetical protein HUJ93_08635, partial [Bacteroidales bacterium]|nr:hypothetical protein [Bacteroidales bacterium]
RGGNQGLRTGLLNLDKFSYLCSYSSFTFTNLPNVFDNAEDTNSKINLFWAGVGTDDFLYGSARDFTEFLDNKGITCVKEYTTNKFGHTWMNAKYFLDKTYRLLFNPEASKAAMDNAQPTMAKTGEEKEFTPSVMARLFPRPIVSPELDGNNVTFRIKAPKAQKVLLESEMLSAPLAMECDSDGVWSATVKDLVPDVYCYNFCVDGTKICDAQNMYLAPDFGFKRSVLNMPEAAYNVNAVKCEYTPVCYQCNAEGKVYATVTPKAVAEDINKRVDEINDEFGYELTGAFASSGLDDGSSWRFSGHLANMPLYYEFKDDGCDLVNGEAEITGKYLDNYKAVWDLYVNTSSADPKTLNSGALDSRSEFGMEEAVFYQQGNWEFSELTNDENGYLVTAEDMGMLPIYFGVDDENQGLCVGTENYWAVNSKASQEDIDATLDFLEWVITSDEGRDSITNIMGLSAPFDTFTGDYESENVFTQDANALMEAGKTSVAWSFNATPNVDDWRADVVSALTAYTDGSGNWDSV